MALCECGCGGETKGGKFLPGHDQKLRSKLEEDTGGLLPLRSLVEAARKYAEDETSLNQFGDTTKSILKSKAKS